MTIKPSLLLLAAASPLGRTEYYSILRFADAAAASADKENELKSILRRMETELLSFRDEMERVHRLRCESTTLADCADGNLYDCSSSFPDGRCMEADELVISACGDGESCNALWDKRSSAISLPASLARGSSNNPLEEEVVESACYSRLAEPYMVDKYEGDEEYWARYNVQPSWTYFGAQNGLFRKIPAIHQETCGQYDPRRRPWFVAASSGPKDVVLVIDVSGSMEDYARLEIAKEAATAIVETLTVADRVAVVAFSDAATRIGGAGGSSGGALVRATPENKRVLAEAIGDLEANGATNFYDAFEAAFDALDATIRNEATSGCNIAMLFMTDGKITTGRGEEEVIDLVNNRTGRLATEFERKTTVFAFSLGLQADHAVTKKLACSTNGIWTPVDDFTGDLVAAMSSYYKLYALGLGEGGNDDFAAWVAPYPFANPAGKMGTTVSVPVYDRSVSPPLFLGVVASDMYLDALELVLGEDAASSTMLDRFVQLSTARCPNIELTECEIDALRFLGGGREATCGACNATDYAGIVPEKCPAGTNLPDNLWHNTDVEGKSYQDRTCCNSGSTEPTRRLNVGFRVESCPASGARTTSSESSGIGLTDGVVIALVVAFALAAAFMVKRKCTLSSTQRKHRPSSATNQSNANEKAAASAPGAEVDGNGDVKFNNETTDQQSEDPQVEMMMRRLSSSLEGVPMVMPPEASAPPPSADALESAP